MSILKSPLYASFFLIIIFLQGCHDVVQREKKIVSGVTGKPQYATLFSVDHTDSCTIISIRNPWQGAENVRFNYYLVRRGMKLPDDLDSSDVIFTPVNRIICMSTTHLAMISALGEENTIVGISGKNYIYSAGIRRKITSDSIKDVGYDTNLNKEMILNLSPDLVMMYGVGSESVGYVSRIRELGTKVFFDAEYLENDPLARAEWIKVFGALYCRDRMADSIFKNEVKAYNDLKLFVNKRIKQRPSVLLGLPFKDTWYISPGTSFMSKLIYDAGGNYLWADNRSKTAVPMGIENVYVKALLADYWLNTGNATSLNEISLVDNRLVDLPCFRNANIYNNNRRITGDGGNDYWESGIIHPHIILKDIASILHPGLFGNYNLVYYRRIK